MKNRGAAEKVHGECEDECSLMDQVNDLMIMGYQANLSFERDLWQREWRC